MDRGTLITAVVGGLIATFPILIGNIVQILLHRSEYRQKKEEAGINSREKWLENDVRKLMDTIENTIALCVDIFDEINSLSIRINQGATIDPEKGKDLKEKFERLAVKQFEELAFEKQNAWNNGIIHARESMRALAVSFENDEIHSGFVEFESALDEFAIVKIPNFLVNMVKPEVISDVRRDLVIYLRRVSSAGGQFHQKLRSYQISLREV